MDDEDSRISRMWKAINIAASENENYLFIKKDIEKIEPVVFGNNRQPLKAAFEILIFNKFIKLVVKHGKSQHYCLADQSLRINKATELKETNNLFKNLEYLHNKRSG